MRGRIRYLVNTLAYLLLATCVATAQKDPGHLIQGPVATLRNGVSIKFSTEVVPAVPHRTVSSIVSPESDVIHRVFLDKRNGQYFGYDLEVERIADSKQFRLLIKPLSPEFQQRLQQDSIYRVHIGNDPKSLAVVSLPRYPEPQLVEAGDLIKVDLLVNPQTGGRVVDLIGFTVQTISVQQASVSQKPPQDFTLENVQLHMADSQLFIDGEMFAERSGSRYAGAVLWFYVPGHGRFIFSILPWPGYDFQKIGIIENNKVSFSLDGHRYEWISSAPVLAPRGHWNLWVLHDPSYRQDRTDTVGKRTTSSGESEAVDSRRPTKVVGSQRSDPRQYSSGAAEGPTPLFQNN